NSAPQWCENETCATFWRKIFTRVLLSRIMIVSVSIFLVGSVKVKLMRYFESSEITRYNMLNQQRISQQNIAIFYLM
ncbi:hypothetical protein ACSGMU_002457, partial [Escherichia coli]